MSIRNEDRHGLSNLQHERVKAFDRFHIPPWLVFALVLLPVSICLAVQFELVDEEINKTHQKALLTAVKKSQKTIEYGEDEITGAEELTIASVQYKKVVEQKKDKE